MSKLALKPAFSEPSFHDQSLDIEHARMLDWIRTVEMYSRMCLTDDFLDGIDDLNTKIFLRGLKRGSKDMLDPVRRRGPG